MSDSYLAPGDIDALGRMLNALLTEHWVLCDRLCVLEKTLVEAGVIDADTVEAYQPSGDFAAQLDSLRNTVFSNVLGAALGPAERSVESLRRRKP